MRVTYWNSARRVKFSRRDDILTKRAYLLIVAYFEIFFLFLIKFALWPKIERSCDCSCITLTGEFHLGLTRRGRLEANHTLCTYRSRVTIRLCIEQEKKREKMEGNNIFLSVAKLYYSNNVFKNSIHETFFYPFFG